MNPGRLGGLIFDFDGTMCDSEAVWCGALTRTYESAGLVFDQERFWAAVGKPADTFDAFTVLARHMGRDVAIIEAELDSAVVLELAALGPASGVRELAQAVHQHGVRLAIASNNTAAHIGTVLDHWELGHLFDVVVGRESGLPQKPDPAPYIRALSLLGVPADQAVAIEDSASGVDSATSAGVHCFSLAPAAGNSSPSNVTPITSVEDLAYQTNVGIRINSR